MTAIVEDTVALRGGERGERSQPRARRSRLELLGPVAVFGLFIGLWYLTSQWAIEAVFNKPKFLVPPPHEVLYESFIDNATIRNELLVGVWRSAQVAFMGLGIAIVVGMSLAVLMSRARWIERSLFPYAVVLQATPILAFVPLISNLLGFDRSSRVFVCVVISLFPIIANTLFGLLSADTGQHDLFTLHGAGRFKRLIKLQLPAAMPSIFTGFRISAGLSVIGAVVGDFFFRQGQSGIGRLISKYQSRDSNPEMYGAVILAGLLGIAVFLLFGQLNKIAVGRWHQSTGQS